MQNSTPQPNSQLTPDEAAASLAFATQMHEQSMGIQPEQQGTEQPQTPQEQGGNTEEPKPKEAPKEEKDPMKEMELMFSQKMDEMRQELKADNQREIDTLKETITQALAEDEPDQTPKNS